MPVGSVVGAAVAGGPVVAAGVVTGTAGVVEPVALEGVEMTDVVITPEGNGLFDESSPLSLAHADAAATRTAVISSARLTARSL
jgi:hypothetical protein